MSQDKNENRTISPDCFDDELIRREHEIDERYWRITEQLNKSLRDGTDTTDWSKGTIIWPRPPSEPIPPRFSITSTADLEAFLPIAADPNYRLLPSELLALVKHAYRMGVFVDEPEIPSKSWLLWTDGDREQFQRTVRGVVKSIGDGLCKQGETQSIGRNVEPLTECDRELLREMLKMGVTDINAKSQSEIIHKITGGTDTKGKFVNLKDRGLIETKKNVGTYLTPKGIEVAKQINGI